MPECRTFLDALFADTEGLFATIFTLPERRVTWFADPDDAARAVATIGDRKNVYVSLALAREPGRNGQRIAATPDPADPTHPVVAGIVGFVADLDFATETKPDRPPDEAAARQVLAEVPCAPSLVVHSGHGVQAWWLFSEPWVFADDAERQRAADLSAGWQARVHQVAAGHGWGLDSVGDLARVMRVPGTVNVKDPKAPVPVRLLSADGPRYAPEDLAEWVLPVAQEAKPAGVAIDLGAAFPHTKHSALCEADPRYRATWDNARTDLHDTSPSGYDLALLTLAAQTGQFCEAELAALLLGRRERWGEAPEKGRRADYVATTVAKAVAAAAQGAPKRAGSPPLGVLGPHASGEDAPLPADPDAPGGAAKKPRGRPGAKAVARVKASPGAPWQADAEADAQALLAAELMGADPYTDVGLARLLAAIATDRLLFSAERGWLTWDGRRWASPPKTPTGVVASFLPQALLLAAARSTDATQRAAFTEAAARAQRERSLNAALSLAVPLLQLKPQVDPGDPRLDDDDWLLNVANGIVDLRTGQLTPHDPRFYLTRLAPVTYDPEAQAPTWEGFLATVLPDPEVRAFVHRAAGYSLSGTCRENIFLVCYGTGRNGKSSFLRAVQDVLGDYASQVNPDFFLVGSRDDSRLSVRLRGPRFVCAAETGQDRVLRENFVKHVTGGDKVEGRALYHEGEVFAPTCVLWLATNHRPRIRGTDPAIWDRVRLVPFQVRIPDDAVNVGLRDELAAEAPGVLAWLVAGARDYAAAKRLHAPAPVQEAGANYRTREDLIGSWLAEATIPAPGGFMLGSRAYDCYRQWAERNNEAAITSRAFADALAERGFQRRKGTGGVRGWSDLALRDLSGVPTNTVPSEPE